MAYKEIYTKPDGGIPDSDIASANTWNNKVPSTRKVNGKALSSDIALTASDVGALPTSGGSLTGNLTVGSSNIGTNGYIEGTWLRTTKATESAGDFATIIGGWIYKRAPANVLGDIGGQPKITANGILKGDGTGNITAADETEVELVDLPIRAEAIIIPKGRMRGDVDGDGKITENDVLQATRHVSNIEILTGVNLWCADANADSKYNSADVIVLSNYCSGITSVLTSTPTFTDYYNNWTYVKVDDLTGYWTTEISIAGLTTSNNVIVNIGETFSMGQFYKAEVSTGKVKIYATRPPINDIPATVVISSGSGKGSIPSYLNDSLLEYKFSLSLPTASWTGSDPYTQTVTIPNSTANTKVDIQPSEELYDQLVADSVGYLAIKNVDGTLTAVAKGGKPSVKLTVQVTYNNVY